MNITKQLILTLSIALLALLLLGVGGAIQLQRAQERFDTVQNRIIPSIQGLNAAKGFLADSRLAGYRLSVFSNLADKTALDKAVASANTNFDKVIATYRAERLYDATDSKMLDADQAAMEAYRRALVPFFAAAYAGDMDGVRATLLAGTPLAITAAAANLGHLRDALFGRGGRQQEDQVEAGFAHGGTKLLALFRRIVDDDGAIGAGRLRGGNEGGAADTLDGIRIAHQYHGRRLVRYAELAYIAEHIVDADVEFQCALAGALDDGAFGHGIGKRYAQFQYVGAALDERVHQGHGGVRAGVAGGNEGDQAGLVVGF